MSSATPFSPEFLKQAETTLLEQKAFLEKELGNKINKSGDEAPAGSSEGAFPDYGDTEEDNAQELADYEANMSIGKGLEKSYRDVMGALGRLAKGTYGICKYCKKPIDEKRLLARPTSSACIECKKTIVQEV